MAGDRDWDDAGKTREAIQGAVRNMGNLTFAERAMQLPNVRLPDARLSAHAMHDNFKSQDG